MNKKNLFFAVCLISFLFVAGNLQAAGSPVGVWKTIDDDGKTEKSYVRIYEKDGLYFGKIIKLLRKPQDTLCAKCKGDKKDKPLVGMDVITGLKKNGDEYSGGEILDPDNGKTYKCKIWREGDKLRVRGYVVFFFRTQTWHLVKE